MGFRSIVENGVDLAFNIADDLLHDVAIYPLTSRTRNRNTGKMEIVYAIPVTLKAILSTQDSNIYDNNAAYNSDSISFTFRSKDLLDNNITIDHAQIEFRERRYKVLNVVDDSYTVKVSIQNV